MPVVERNKVLHNGSQGRNLIFGVVVHHLLGQLGPISIRAVDTELLFYKALQSRNI